MTNIYQDIWDADQTGSGLRPIVANADGDASHGYVKVDTNAVRSGGRGDARILTEVSMPTAKERTYLLARKLFDNYALSEAAMEVETQEEREEVHDLLQAVLHTAPMQVAREYVAAATGTTISADRWYATLLEMWFRRFSAGGDPDLSGFEHVFVGEQEGPKVQGYHFWYKYYLDDGLAAVHQFPGLASDQIVYLGSQQMPGQESFPETVTISYRWDAPDYDAKKIRPLTKPKGGFFVGCSVEGLMALGTVRAHIAARAPKEATINGARYDMKLFRSPDNKNVRTFFPIYLGRAEQAPRPEPQAIRQPASPSTMTGKVRIVAALVNPLGRDEDHETVTLQNMGSDSIDLAGWRLVDKNRNHFEIGSLELGGGTGHTITLPRGTMQLSNQGGEIRLVDRTGRTAHLVMYSRAQASEQGVTIAF